MTIDEAYAFCRGIAHKHGANFSVGFRFLPRTKRRAVYAAYAYCRWADDIADESDPVILSREDGEGPVTCCTADSIYGCFAVFAAQDDRTVFAGCWSCSAAIVLVPARSARMPSTHAVAADSVVMHGIPSCSAFLRM